MKNKYLRNMTPVLAIVMAVLMLTGFQGSMLVSGAEAEPEVVEEAGVNETNSMIPGGAGDQLHTRGGQNTEQPAAQKDNNRQLTAEDIDVMNDGDCALLFSEDGYLTFLRGRYYDEKVTNYEEAVQSLNQIQSLLGISKGSEFFCVYGQRNDKDYTCYTFLQRYGDITIQNAVLKVFVDPEGYTCGLTSSFTPNVGIAPEDESSITPEEALEIVKAESQWGDELKFYPEETRQTSVTDPNGVTSHCWAVFSGIPPEFSNQDLPPYMQHLVSYDGSYMYYLTVNSPQEMMFGEDVQTQVALSWFDGLQADTYTGIVTKHDGTQKEITVPVVYDPNKGLYYLADLKRHILLTDYYNYMVEHRYDPFTSKDNTGWPDIYLLTYDTYIKVYDFYETLGIQSVDDYGAPILILANWCTEDASRTPIYNAVFMGIEKGWAMFGASSIGNFGECVDVIGHEFTHGVFNYASAGWNYANASGAISEGLSDVMGNLIEEVLEETEDTTWLISENGDEIFRSMSVPWLYQQPVTVDGRFFVPLDVVPTDRNDYGGVHTNSSLINYVAWKLHEAGMDPMEELRLYREVLSIITPLSGLKEFHQALLFAGVMRDLDIRWLVMIDMFCEEAGY